MGKSFFAEIEIDDKEVEAVFSDLEKAVATISNCIDKLYKLGFIKIKAASSEDDGAARG